MESAFALVALIVVLAIHRTLRRRSITGDIPGPPSASWVFGHMLQLLLPAQYGDHEFAWQKAYGPIYRLKGCFGEDRLMISDPVACQYILNSPHFEHGPIQKNGIDILVPEECVMRAHGDAHKHFRAAMNPGFSASAVRNHQAVFERVAQTMIERLEAASGSTVDICPVLSDATLSTASEAVLGYEVKDLDKELVVHNEQLLALAAGQSTGQVLAGAAGAYLPKWVFGTVINLPTATFSIVRTAKRLAIEVGEKIIREKTDAARQGSVGMTDVFDMLLHPGQNRNKLTESEIAAQTGILLIGGQDTTANTMAFGLLELAKHPEFQRELHAEILSSGGGHNAAYENMPLLNAFIKETLRLYPVGPLQERIARQDTIIPLADGITTLNGELIKQIPVRKGQTMHIAIASYQRLESRWGEDVHEFRPSRWLDGSVKHGQAVGPYANILTFLGGPRVCLGWRFAILEMQVFFAELVGNFSFAYPGEDDAIRMQFAGSLMPILPSGEKGAPLCITRL
ncbi:cytochrome P450 [Mycena vitilis]|nr:cytochrome P450 [Mycena vitilis]